MDTTPTAGQTPVAAPVQSEADAFLSAGGGFNPQQPQEPQPQQTEAPVAYDAPGSPQQGEPTGSTQDAATTTSEPQIDPAVAAHQAELERIRYERDMAAEEVSRYRQAQLMAAQQEQMRQIEQARAERVSQAHAVAENMIRSGDTEGGLSYLRRFEDETRMADWQAAQAQIANTRVQSEQQVHRALAPQYARHLVATNNLPESYVTLLQQYDGNQQDAMVPHLVAQHQASSQQQTAREAQLEQRLREIEAQQKSMNPAFFGGGTGGAGSPSQGQRPSNPRDAELWDYLNAPPLTR